MTTVYYIRFPYPLKEGAGEVDEATTTPAMAKSKGGFYAVAKGRNPGIYTTWYVPLCLIYPPLTVTYDLGMNAMQKLKVSTEPDTRNSHRLVRHKLS